MDRKVKLVVFTNTIQEAENFMKGIDKLMKQEGAKLLEKLSDEDKEFINNFNQLKLTTMKSVKPFWLHVEAFDLEKEAEFKQKIVDYKEEVKARKSKPIRTPLFNPNITYTKGGFYVSHTACCSFSQVKENLSIGCMAFREGNEDELIFEQIPAHIPKAVIPKMQSLSTQVKTIMTIAQDDITEEDNKGIHYDNQWAKMSINEGKLVVTTYIPTVEDINATDWNVISATGL